MNGDVTFQLDIVAARSILTDNAAELVQKSAEAIGDRATNMAAKMSHKPVTVSVETQVGTIKNGKRAIGTVTAKGTDPHSDYIGYMALSKARDAGRV